MENMKKPKFIILGVVGAILLVIVVIAFKTYYDDYYVWSDYYAMIPLDYKIAPEEIYDKGEYVGLRQKYTIIAYNEKGESKEIRIYAWDTSGAKTQREDDTGIIEPGTYIYVNSARKIVINWNVVEKSEIPNQILEYVK